MPVSQAAYPSRASSGPAFFLMLAMAAVVGGALLFQHLGGYLPCKLCLEQRLPYYIGAPLMAVAWIAGAMRAPRAIPRGLLAVGGLLMLYGLYLAVYHAGVEWAFWPGPSDCGAVVPAADTGGNGVLDSLNSVTPPACDHAALRILGLSLAGWNAIASLILAAVALWAAFRPRPAGAA